MKSLWKPHILIWIALLALLGWAIQGIPFGDVWEVLRGIKTGSILVLIAVNLGILLLFSGRWWLILRGQGYRLPYLSLAVYRLAAFSITYFTPGQQFGGEPLQVHLIRDRHQIPSSSAVASVTLDKLLELLVNFSFLVFGLGIALNGGVFGRETTGHILLLAIVLLSLPSGYLLALWFHKHPLTWLSELLPGRLAGHFPRLQKAHWAIASTEEQVAQFCRRKPGVLFQGLGFSLLVWAAMIMEYWLTLNVLGLHLSLAETISALTAARLAFLLPLPGGLGALEASQVIAMQALGIQPALGVSLSLLIRARDLTFGGAGLWWVGVLSKGRSGKSLPSTAGD